MVQDTILYERRANFYFLSIDWRVSLTYLNRFIHWL
jgi:hypothetical protein